MFRTRMLLCGAMVMIAGCLVGAAHQGGGLKEQVAKWVGEHAAAGSVGAMKHFSAKFMETHGAPGEHFYMVFGEQVMKSGKATQLHGYSGQLFAFELSKEQAKLVPQLMPMSIQASARKTATSALPTGEARLRELVFDRKGPWEAGKAITGKVNCEVVGKALPEGAYDLRISFEVGGKPFELFKPMKVIPGKGKIPFSFEIKARGAEPVVVFIDLVRWADKSTAKIDAVSNAVGVMIDVAPTGR